MEWKDAGVQMLSFQDEYGNSIRCDTYDTNKNLISNQRFELEYDENGNIIKSVETVDGEIFQEVFYTIIDGVSEITSTTQYEKDGTIYSWETAISSSGELYTTKMTTNETNGNIHYVEYNEHSDFTRMQVHNEDGELIIDRTYEYIYSDGMIMEMKCYETYANHSTYEYVDENGVSQTENETFYNSMLYITKYNDDRSYTITAYDENNNFISENHYDANGNNIDK